MIYELEVRLYGIFVSDLFVSFLKDKFGHSFISKSSDTVYLFQSEDRYIQTDTGIQKIKKEVIMEKKFGDKKFSVSTESESTETTLDIKKSKGIRTRLREIYDLPNDIQLHITKINDSFYEVEIEREVDITEIEWEEESETILSSFVEAFNSFFEEIETYSKMFESFLIHFNGPMKTAIGTMSKSVIAKPRDLKKKDFITEKGKGLPEGYTLTIKGNGVPIILYFKKRYLFMISPFIYFKLLRETNKDFNEEFMIIGEYIGKETVPIFAPFDILYSSRHKNVRNHPNHLQRLEFAFDILERNSKEILGSSIKVFKKDFIPIGSTPSSFAKAYSKIKGTSYPFEDDGMILTPTYYPQNTILPKDAERQLSKYPEICKIKPWNELSVDLMIDISKKEVYTSHETKPYKGSTKFAFDAKTVIDWESIPVEMDKKIVELVPFRLSGDEVQDLELDFVMKFSRHRTDKDEPNHKTTLDRVWSKIRDPLDEKIFLAKDGSRLWFQNNRVKKQIISSIPKGSIVIDIGSGFGGDIFKYNGIAEIVICVEPFETNRKELIKRLKNSKNALKTRYEVLSCGGEDTEIIMETFRPIRDSLPNAHVAVCSMLSLTFFWKNKEYLGLFKRTLTEISKYSRGATFYFYTIEGNRFKKYFDENGGKIKNSIFRAQYDETATDFGVGIPGRLKIEIYDTIVILQREYLVELNDLKDILRDLQVKDGKIESYLTEDESKYADCHISGRAKIEFSF